MKISVIVPVYNRKDYIRECLNSLLDQTVNDYEIIIIDDGSTDGTKDILKEYQSPIIKIYYNSTRIGPSYSRNKAIEQSGGEFIALTDSDCKVDRLWLSELIKPFSEDNLIMITTGNIIDPQPTNYWQLVNKGGDFLTHKSGYVKKAIGCNMALRRDFALKNRFDEKITCPAAEEFDLCLRCLKQGYKIYYTPLAKVVHLRRSDLKTTMLQQFRYGYYNTYVNIKDHHFPYINYGSWLLIGALITLPFGSHKPAYFHWVSITMFLMYLALVLSVSIMPGVKTLFEIIIGYPGFLVSCFANFLGNISYLICMLKPVLRRLIGIKEQFVY